VVPQGSNIKTLADVKGKTIGIDGIGSGPQIDLSIALRSVGVNPKTDVSWRAYPPAELSAAVKKKEIDAFIVWDPFASFAVADEKYTTLLDIAVDEPFKSGYCCFVVVSAKLVKEDPKRAAAYTRAILRGAAWVGKNPAKAAALEVDNKYVPGDVKQIAALLASYNWNPSVAHAKDVAKFFIAEQKKDGILEATTDEAKLLDRLYATVVTDAEVKL
jgi:NitT/TauT family transport system substrate-binding protein